MTKTDSNKSPIRITARDKQLLQKLSEYRLLSTEQIRYLLYPSMNRARKRILQLFRHGLVARFTRPVRLGEGSSQYIYRPSRKGESLIHQEPLGPKLATRSLTETQGKHALQINDFRVALELAERIRDDFSLAYWKPDREVKVTVPVTIRQKPVQVPIVPDGVFSVRIQDKDFFYMLEIDRATTPLNRIRIKLEAYLSFWHSRPHLADLGIPTFRILWVTSGKQRLQNLLGIIQALTAKYPRTDIAFLTTQDQVRLDQPEHILGKVWQLVHRTEVLLTSPFPAIPFERSRSHQVNHQCANQKPELAKGEHGPGG
ncbi:MAG: replication-relaxation family protein [candidate division Zixibacteria bacterium]|nr:replication-relaxation family protein [candidate division Zixibacteria bacterium]